MRSLLLMTRPGLLLIPALMAFGALTQGAAAVAASQVLPPVSCAQAHLDGNSGTYYNCPIATTAATTSVKVTVYFNWSYAIPANGSGKPFDSTIQCDLIAYDQYGLSSTLISGTIVLPVTKRVSAAPAQIVFPSVPSLNGGYGVSCVMPSDVVDHFFTTMGSVKVVSS